MKNVNSLCIIKKLLIWDKIIKDRHLFDDEFENVHEKYKALLDKYGFIVNIFLELLFPQFLREIWKNKN